MRTVSNVVPSVCGDDIILTHFLAKYKICPTKKEDKRGRRTDAIIDSRVALDWPCKSTPMAMSARALTARHECSGGL